MSKLWKKSGEGVFQQLVPDLQMQGLRKTFVQRVRRERVPQVRVVQLFGDGEGLREIEDIIKEITSWETAKNNL